MTDLALLSLAVVLMLTGAAMLIGGTSSVLPFALIAVGIAITVVQARPRPRSMRS
jgi:hypothetical protein